MRMTFRETLKRLVPENPSRLLRDVVLYVLPGVLLFTAFDLLRSHLLNNGLNAWAMSNVNWWIALQRLFFVVEVYLIFVPAILVGVIHYLRVSGLRPTVGSIFFARHAPVLVILLAFVFITLSIVDSHLSVLTRPLVAVFGEPVVQALFDPAERQGFWFNLVRGLFVTLVSVLALVPAIYLFARFSFALVRYVSPDVSVGVSSWSLTSGAVGARLAALLALTPFVRFVLNEVISAPRIFYLPISDPNLLWAVIFADSVLLRMAQVVFLVVIGAIVATVYRQVVPQFANVQAVYE